MQPLSLKYESNLQDVNASIYFLKNFPYDDILIKRLFNSVSQESD